ncbi:MAG TPA: DUF2934 domain-containing protein [Steroidobacteraceae bacterium]|nr:DUF2934 domain-containing protein [Steroidobacteraceae bacterium]
MTTSKRKTSRTNKSAQPSNDSTSPSLTSPSGATAVHEGGGPSDDRHATIAEAAYYRSQHRGFAPGHELEDWLAAEAEVEQRQGSEGRVS